MCDGVERVVEGDECENVVGLGGCNTPIDCSIRSEDGDEARVLKGVS